MNPKNSSQIHYILFLAFLSVLTASAQEKSNSYDLCSLLENNRLESLNRQISTFSENGKRGIRLSKNENDGVAWLKGVEFSNGTIELDIRGKDVFQQSFVGVAFHGIDKNILDAVYFRPFNFQSPDPVRLIHAIQYVSHPDQTWNILREKFKGQYEKAVKPTPNANDWFHARIVVQYPHIMVFVNGNTEPSLSIDKLNTRRTGKIGIWVGNNSDGDFANLQITSKYK